MGKRYIRNLAKSLIGQLDITVFDLEPSEVPETLYARRNEQIKLWLERVSPEKLGQIAAWGRRHDTGAPNTWHATSLYDVHQHEYLNVFGSGLELLRELACTAIVAEMTDILKLESINLDHRVRSRK